MPLELQIIRSQEFVRLGPSGGFDLKASKAALAVLVTACLKRSIHQALMDLRALQPGPKPVFSPGDLVSLVNTFREIGFTSRHRLAVLYTFDPHERARMFASIARLRGWTVKAFDSFEQAVAWLSTAAPAEAEARDASRKREPAIPVRKVRVAQKPHAEAEPFQPIIRKKPHPRTQRPLIAPVQQALQTSGSA